MQEYEFEAKLRLGQNDGAYYCVVVSGQHDALKDSPRHDHARVNNCLRGVTRADAATNVPLQSRILLRSNRFNASMFEYSELLVTGLVSMSGLVGTGIHLFIFLHGEFTPDNHEFETPSYKPVFTIYHHANTVSQKCNHMRQEKLTKRTDSGRTRVKGSKPYHQVSQIGII